MPRVKEAVVVGAGHVFREIYQASLASMPDIRLAGVVDPVFREDIPTVSWTAGSLDAVPPGGINDDTMVMVLTPDHWPVIRELVAMGARLIYVEKPLVSRIKEIAALRELTLRTGGLKVYAADFYIPKLFPLKYVLGGFREGDPRATWVGTSVAPADLRGMLGEIVGIAVQVLEGGDHFDVDSRTWLEQDPEIGGMLRDLGTHALAPLASCGLLDMDARVHLADLARLTPGRTSLQPVQDTGEVELYASALLTQFIGERNVPVHVTLGKVPFDGGVWNVTVRGTKGQFHAGLYPGDSAILLEHGAGRHVTFDLPESQPYLAVREALAWFNGELASSFDGNVDPFLVSIELIEQIRFVHFN